MYCGENTLLKSTKTRRAHRRWPRIRGDPPLAAGAAEGLAWRVRVRNRTTAPVSKEPPISTAENWLRKAVWGESRTALPHPGDVVTG
jgi:hypothetical protein